MPHKEEVARYLAQCHYNIEPGITEIFTLCETPEYELLPTTPIKLLEVNENTVASGVMPLHFAPSKTIPFPSIIVEVTPIEFDQIKSNQMKLPNGWSIGDAIPRGEE